MWPLIKIFQARSNSREGNVSFVYRFTLLKNISQDLPNIPFLGFGPGLGSQGFAENGFRTILDNGVGQLIYSLGILLTILILLLAALWFGRRVREREAKIVILIPWTLLFLSTNFINDNFTSIALLGILALILNTNYKYYEK
jgi:hypothetical protein